MTNSTYDGLPPIAEFIKKYGLNALKSLGQNFIMDMNLTDRIARSVPNLANSVVVEVGSGPGALTRALLKNGAYKVVAVEFDKRAVGALEELGAAYPGRLEILQADALRVDYSKFIEEGRDFRICANLPYNISVPLLIEWLYMGARIDSMTLMFQKEVGVRIVAKPRGKDYSRLSILAQVMCRTKILFEVAKTCFVPQPKVTSCIVQFLKASNQPSFDVLERLEIIAKEAFSERRKMLRTTLADYAELFDKVGIRGTQRAEEISPEKFLALAEVVSDIE